MLRVLLPVVLTLLSGCAACDWTKSRWAMDDPVYAEHYADGAPRYDIPGKAKQLVDARHLAGHSGGYLSAGAQNDPLAVSGQVGLFGQPSSWSTIRGGVGVTADELANDMFVGLDLGARLQSPSRVAPFVGLGLFNGYSKQDVDASQDGIDNDDDLIVDEAGEQREKFDGWRTSFYPEVGMHWWVTSRFRVSGHTAYHITTEGRDHDFWMFGITAGWLWGHSRGFSDAYDRAW